MFDAGKLGKPLGAALQVAKMLPDQMEALYYSSDSQQREAVFSARSLGVELTYTIFDVLEDHEEVALPARAVGAAVGTGECIVEGLGDELVVVEDDIRSRVPVLEISASELVGPVSDVHHSVKATQALDFHDRLNYVLKMAATTDGRPHLEGVCFHRGHGLAATNGHALNVSPFDAVDPEKDRIIPGYAVQVLIRVLKQAPKHSDVVLSWGSWGLLVTFDAWTFRAQYADARFPPIEKVIPTGIEDEWNRAEFNAKKLDKVLKKIKKSGSVVATEFGNYDGAVLQVTADGLTVTSPDRRLSVDLAGNSTVVEPDKQTMANATYMKDAIPTDGIVYINPDDTETSPIRIDHDLGTSVVMPMRP